MAGTYRQVPQGARSVQLLATRRDAKRCSQEGNIRQQIYTGRIKAVLQRGHPERRRRKDTFQRTDTIGTEGRRRPLSNMYARKQMNVLTPCLPSLLRSRWGLACK